MLEQFNNVLVLAPHTDDGEIGCGGLISKLKRLGKKVTYVAFSTCEESLPLDFPKNTLEVEVSNATNVLKIDELIIYKFKVRHFPQYRQEILEILVKLNKKIKPDLVLLPMSTDIHQDHKTIYEEGVRAFKKNNLFGYELVWNNFILKNQLFIKLEEIDILNKIKSIEEYKSQNFRDYINGEFIKSLAVVRGKQINYKYCETFEIIRMIC
jgi:N-acetylglucosamine malate deacetylase 1